MERTRLDNRSGWLTLLALLASSGAQAGAFIFGSSLPDSITHPQGYTGQGGPLELRICIRPGSQNSLMRIPVQNIVDRFRLQVAAQPNLELGSANDVGSNEIDFESVALHELGHCVGLAHPNAASESNLPDPQQDSTKALPGSNGVLDPDAGSDGRFGSPDDDRADDVNLHWFVIGVNDPFLEPQLVDGSNYGRELNLLPSGDDFAANADRDVGSDVYGIANSEAVMQQGTFFDEAQRFLAADDVTTLRFAQSGLDRVAGTSDDYSLDLVYGGISSSSSCDVTLGFDSDAGFAFCAVSGRGVGATDVRLDEADAFFAPPSQVDWEFTGTRIPFPAPDVAVVAPGDETDRVNGGEESLLANDSHPEGRSLRVTPGQTFGGPTEGTVDLNADGTFSYDHGGRGEGTDFFVYEVCVSGSTICSHQRVLVQISASANQPPTALADALGVAEGGTATTLAGGGDSVLDNDDDSDGDGLTVSTTPASPPMNGSVTLMSDGTFEYVHDGSETTTDAFSYEVCDDREPALCAIGTVAVAVSPVNDPASAVDDDLPNRDEDTSTFRLFAVAMTVNDSAGDGEDEQRLTITELSDVLGGSAVLVNGNVEFTPAPDFFGDAGFRYTISDDGQTDGEPDPSTASAVARFELRAVNDPPLLVDDLLSPVAEDSGPRTIEADELLANDLPGPDNEADQTLTLLGGDNPVGGSFSINGQTIVFTPAPDFSGEASFLYRAGDDGRSGGASDPESATATARFTVTPVPDDPRPGPDALTVLPGGTVSALANGSATLLANDVDPEGQPLAASVGDVPAAGIVTIDPSGAFEYGHGGGSPGFDSFTYDACDAADATRCGAANVTVAILDPGVAYCAPGASRAVAGAPFLIDVSDQFPDGSSVFTANGLPAGLTIDAAGGAISGAAEAGAVQAAPYQVVVTATGAPGITVTLTIRVDAAGEPIHYGAFEDPCLAELPAG